MHSLFQIIGQAIREHTFQMYTTVSLNNKRKRLTVVNIANVIETINMTFDTSTESPYQIIDLKNKKG